MLAYLSQINQSHLFSLYIFNYLLYLFNILLTFLLSVCPTNIICSSDLNPTYKNKKTCSTNFVVFLNQWRRHSCSINCITFSCVLRLVYALFDVWYQDSLVNQLCNQLIGPTYHQHGFRRSVK